MSMTDLKTIRFNSSLWVFSCLSSKSIQVFGEKECHLVHTVTNVSDEHNSLLCLMCTNLTSGTRVPK